MLRHTSQSVAKTIRLFLSHYITVSMILLAMIGLALTNTGTAARSIAKEHAHSTYIDENVTDDPASVKSPSQILFTYQGQLLDASGNPLTNNSLPMIFRLFIVPTAGSPCWTENHTGPNSVSVQNGLFHVQLGRITSLPVSCFSSDTYLELEVNGQTLTPRELLTSVAFSLEAMTVSNGAISSAKLADNAVTSAKIQDGQVTSADIMNDTISEIDIVDSFKARDSDMLDSLDSSAFSLATHNHDNRYYTEAESDSRFVNATGDTVMGDLTTTGRLWAQGELWSEGNLSVYASGLFGYPSSGEGGEIVLRAGSSGNAWIIDNYYGRWRLHHDGTEYVGVASNGDTYVNGKLTVTGPDLILHYSPRGNAGRALVHMNSDTLVVNYDGDFSGGVRMDSNLNMNGNRIINVGALVEANLQTQSELLADRIERFEEGDVLCWGLDQLELCMVAGDRLVQAVADFDGRPIVIGAEPVKVIGPAQRGDILVASDIPGYAKVDNNPTPGSVIAQALEDFSGERGLIRAMIRKW